MKVENINGQYVYGKMNNNPTTKGILVGDSVKLKLRDNIGVI